jgi:lysylphosphatidylglycerol synthetase-like protein (DUF2156 family)
MWNFMHQSGPATAVLDFTSDFSVLLAGLVGFVGVAAGMIVWIAIRHHLSQKRLPPAKTMSAATDRRDAA